MFNYKRIERRSEFMFNLLAQLLAGVSTLSTSGAATACSHVLFDEPECPKSLIEK